MYNFDYCRECLKLFNFEDVHCKQCNSKRFEDNQKMQIYFLQANLEDIQQYFFKGICCSILFIL